LRAFQIKLAEALEKITALQCPIVSGNHEVDRAVGIGKRREPTYMITQTAIEHDAAQERVRDKSQEGNCA